MEQGAEVLAARGGHEMWGDVGDECVDRRGGSEWATEWLTYVYRTSPSCYAMVLYAKSLSHKRNLQGAGGLCFSLQLITFASL